MKAEINGVKIEGTPQEMAEVIRLIGEQNLWGNIQPYIFPTYPREPIVYYRKTETTC